MIKSKKYATLMVMIIISFGGFLTENFFTSLTIGKITNKNMILPFLFGYGIGLWAIYMLFGTPDKPEFFRKKLTFSKKLTSYLYYFTVAFLSVSIGEVVLGYATEWLCDIIWWDYSTIPLNFTKYTSLPTSTAFGIMIVIIMKYIFIPLREKFEKMNSKVLAPLAITLTTLLSLDMLNSALYMFIKNDTLHIWSIKFEPLINIIINLF